MSTTRSPVLSTLLWVLWHMGFRFMPGARALRRRDVQRLQKGHGCLGRGILRDHIVPDALTFEAVCALPVDEVGGSLDRATCRSCKRIYRKAMREHSEDATAGN